jgi:putative transposase
MARSIRATSLQKFASVHASLYNHFNPERDLVARQIYKLRSVTAQLAWEFVGA